MYLIYCIYLFTAFLLNICINFLSSKYYNFALPWPWRSGRLFFCFSYKTVDTYFEETDLKVKINGASPRARLSTYLVATFTRDLWRPQWWWWLGTKLVGQLVGTRMKLMGGRRRRAPSDIWCQILKKIVNLPQFWPHCPLKVPAWSITTLWGNDTGKWWKFRSWQLNQLMRSPTKLLLAELQSNKFHPSFGICPWCEESFFYMFDFAFSRSGGLQQRWFVQINAILTKLPQIFYHNFSKLTNILHQKKLESWIWSRFTFLLNLFKKASFAMKPPNAAWLQCS